MGKSRAEIQKDYRQRLKKKNNEEYLRKERERMRRNYVSSSQMSENDRRKRNKNNREKLRRFYERKRELRRQVVQTEQETSGYETNESQAERGRLRVRMAFPNNRRKGALVRWKRELSDASSRIRLLEQERKKLNTKYKTAQRALQRMRLKANKAKMNETNGTPLKSTERLMEEADLTNRQRDKIRKSLLLGNFLLSEIRQTKSSTPKGVMSAVHRVISGKIVKKYKCARMLARETGLCRHRLSKTESKNHQIKRSSRVSTVKRHQRQVEHFLKREDNSKLQPGKADVKTLKKNDKRQVYILTDYLSNLCTKFKSENPESEISFTSFTRSRPKYILLTSFSSRMSCLCTKHQNATLTMKVIKQAGVDVPVNPEKALDNLPSVEILQTNLPEIVTWNQWARVEVEEKGKKKSVTRIVESKLNRDEFIEKYNRQMKDFDGHVKRVRTQYEGIKILKQNLPAHDIIVQLDFAENYSCRATEEVQSAYFNQTSVTLHPMVAYYRGADGSLSHKSFVIVSNELGHKASTVIAFIESIMPALKSLDQNLDTIHYWSDSPTSQYRNRHIFNLIANHNQHYGVKARWNFFEAGHGKGPCDGIGGTCKRLADEATRNGNAIIQDAFDFFKWAKTSSMTNVEFRFVSSDECKASENEIEKSKVQSVRGTMKIHAVVGLGESKIKTRDVSCYCAICLQGNTCTSWSIETTRSGEPEIENEIENEHDNEKENGVDKTPETVPNIKEFCIGNFVAAVYEGHWFIGRITDKDEEEYEITFMERKKQFYQWPRVEDKLWIKHEAVLTRINALKATGKSNRMFIVSEIDIETINKLYTA